MNYKLFLKKNVSLARCPVCNEIASLRRSRSRNLFEKFVKYFKFRFYSCQKCGWRGIIYPYRFAKNFIFLILLYTLSALFSIYVVEKFLQSYFN